MTAPNTEVTNLKVQLGYGSKDGVAVDNANAIRTNPKQGVVTNSAFALLTSYNANGGTLSETGANTAANQSITATGLLATDFVIGVTKPTSQANLGYAGTLAANDAVAVNFITSNGAVTAKANEAYSVTAIRGAAVISATLTPSAVVTKTAAEQIFTITPSGATATALISGGAVVGANLTAGGAGYYCAPTVTITAAAGDPGVGATAIALIAGGAVVGIQITNPGSGYVTAPTISFVGGNNIAPGMVVAIEKAAYQANLGIGNVRVAGNNKIGITFVNVGANVTPTAAETYRIYAFNEMSPATPVIKINANLANCTAAAANTSNKTDVTVAGITTTDMMLVMNKALASPLVFGGGVCTANTVSFIYGGGVPGGTPANGVYNFSVLKPALGAPVKICAVTISPSSVAANSAAEQVFTLPTGFTLQANSTVIVNKPSCTPNIAVVGARANSTTTLAINFMNVSNTAITPPQETYLVANFPSYAPTISANQIEGYCTQIVSPAVQGVVDLVNEQQQVLKGIGAIAGA